MSKLHICSVSVKQPQPPLPPSCYKHTAAPWSLCFLRAEPDQTDTFWGRVPSPCAPDTVPPLPIQTPFVTPRPPELHFYSGRHVRARVRLHLRRVTGNNNTETTGGQGSGRRHEPNTSDLWTEEDGKCRGEADYNDTVLLWQNRNILQPAVYKQRDNKINKYNNNMKPNTTIIKAITTVLKSHKTDVSCILRFIGLRR